MIVNSYSQVIDVTDLNSERNLLRINHISKIFVYKYQGNNKDSLAKTSEIFIDTSGYLIKQIDCSLWDSNSCENHVYSYNSLGKLLDVNFTPSDNNLKINDSYIYDNANSLIRIISKKGDSITQTVDFTYNSTYSIDSKNECDLTNRPKICQRIKYEYDSIGNIINEFVNDTLSVKHYYKGDDIIFETEIYFDNKGDTSQVKYLESSRSTKQPIKVTQIFLNNNKTIARFTFTYHYDKNKRLIQEGLIHSGKVKKYYYSKNDLLSEIAIYKMEGYNKEILESGFIYKYIQY